MKDKNDLVRINPGNPAPLGVSSIGECYNFAVFLPQAEKCEIHIYDMGPKEAAVTLSLFEREEQPGIFTGQLFKKELPEKWAYLYAAAGKEFMDPYAKHTAGREKFGVPGKLYAVFQEETEEYNNKKFLWGEDKHPHIPYQEMILYKLHVRGFTMAAPGVRHKGTYRGLLEKKSYLKELGINAVLLLPCVEFDEIIRKEQGYYSIPVITEEMKQKGIFLSQPQEEEYRVNYWGFAQNNCYFAPKASYASEPEHADREFKQMVKGLHESGIEVLMEMNFQPSDNPNLILESLIWWVQEYHVDGFRINTELVPERLAALHPALAGIKLLSTGFRTDWIYGADIVPDPVVLAEYNDGFLSDIRRFVKGDEEMIGRVAARLERQTGKQGIINYVTDNNGFTLADLYSYDVKHNEANGEDNADGTDYNYSWNCGQEGKTRKKKIVKLRNQMKKNALALLFLSQGTPMLLAGDEFGNSQEGNNNAYCQDNETGWLSWKELRQNQEVFEFTKQLIKIRKEHPVFRNLVALKGMDYISCGCPDISRHGTKAWYPDYSNYSRTLALLLCGKYAMLDKVTADDSFYLAANMHWEPHEFDLPATVDGENLVFLLSTDEECSREITSRTFLVPARAIVLFQGRKAVPPEGAVKKANRSKKGGRKAE